MGDRMWGVLIGQSTELVEAMKEALDSTEQRTEGAYLAVVVMLFCAAWSVGIFFLLLKIAPSMLNGFREEMQIERKSHEGIVDAIMTRHESSLASLLSKFDQHSRDHQEAMQRLRDEFVQTCDIMRNDYKERG